MPEPRPAVPGHVLRQVIGRGASSTVYAARSASTGEEEAVKVTDPAVKPPDYVLALAAREQAIQQRVSSEHVVRLRDTVRLADGAVALVMDLADGGSLEELVARRGALVPGEVATMVTPLATTLAELRAAGVVHTDLAPGNVLFTRDGKPMLADYDAARIVGELHPQAATGTPGFVAPEVRDGGLPTAAGDVWSLGALAWYALSGGRTPPDDASETATRVLGPALGAVVGPMLVRDPAARAAPADVAAGVYRAATPTPVRLLLGDEVANVATPTGPTPRGVEAPAPATTPTAVPTTAPAATPAEAPASTPAAAPTVSRRERSARGGSAGRGRLSTRARLILVAVGGVAFVALFLVLLARLGPTGSGAPDPGGTTGVSGSPSGSAATGAAPTDLQGVTPVALLQDLVDTRAQALTTRDPAALLGSEVEGSALHARDAGVIADLTTRGLHYDGLAFRVRSASVVTRTSSQLEVDAVVERGAYRVVAAGKPPRSEPAAAASSGRYVLRATPAGWRLDSASARTG